MNKLKITLTALLMSIAIAGYAGTPAPNDVPRRFVLVKMAWEHCCLKLNTRTGEVWFVKGDSDIEKIQSHKCTGIQPVSESDSFDGRFCVLSVEQAGIPWVYVLDSKTGDLWALEYARRRTPDYTFIRIP